MLGKSADSAREPGLFVLWETGREFQDRILDDLGAHFHINRVTEFHWDPAMVWANYQRFYSDTHIRGSAHARNKGSGPFLAVSVIVDSPTYERRMTRNRGMRVVNCPMFDAKTRYREWSDGWGIHCGENLAENIRDSYMLYGRNSYAWEKCEPYAWDGKIEVLHEDPLGAHGWQSFDELLGALNRSVDYVLLRYGPDQAALQSPAHGHAFDILTSDYNEVHSILHSGPRIPAPLKRGGAVEVLVDDAPVRLNLHFPGDGLFDESWATALLDSRELDPRGFFRPRQDERYWLMAHHSITQREPVERELMRATMATAADPQLLKTSDLPADDAELRSLLTDQLVQRGIWRPITGSRLGTSISIAMLEARQRYQVLASRVRTTYFTARDLLLAHLPFLTSLKRSLKTLASGH